MTKQDFTLTGTGFKGFPEGGLGSEGAAGELERAFAEAELGEEAEAGIGILPEDDGDLLQGMGISLGEEEISEMLEKAGVLRDGKLAVPGGEGGGMKLSASGRRKQLRDDRSVLASIMKAVFERIMEAEMEERLGAAKSERKAGRAGYRSGYYTRKLATRVGTLELRVPQTRDGRFSTSVFESYQRSDKALVAAMVSMYVNGVSTRKVRRITEELCGVGFSAGTISNMVKGLDEELTAFARRPLEEEYPYLILDARYEKVRENGVAGTRAVQIALGVGWDGRCEVLGVELANRESGVSWRDFLRGLRERGLGKVRYVVSDDHKGLREAVPEELPEAVWQRCFAHFVRNARDKLPGSRRQDMERKNACMDELKLVQERGSLEEARDELAAWQAKWEGTYPKLVEWVDANIGETLTCYALPKMHRKRMRTTNTLERMNQEIRRRTRIVRVFPNEESCRRLAGAVSVEIHEGWLAGNRFLDMGLRRELMEAGQEAEKREAA